MSAATITTRRNGLLDVTVVVDGETLTIGQEIHDPADAARIARDWERG